MALLTTAGQPLDNFGADGDYALDNVNRMLWGPKATTWANTAQSTVGPAGPAILSGQGAPAQGLGNPGQAYVDTLTGNIYGPKKTDGSWGAPTTTLPTGPAGLSILTGTGAPLNANGAQGQTYIDTQALNIYFKSNGVWSAGQSLQGAPGPTYLTGLSAGVGPYALANAVTLSSTPYVMVYPGTTIASQFTPLGASALMGFYIYASAACTVSLFNVTAGTTVVSQAITAGQNFNSGYLQTNQYPLIAGNTYQWQLTGTASTSAQLEPFYLMPANSAGVCVGIAGPAGFNVSTTFSATALQLPPFGTTRAVALYAHVPPRTGGVYSAQATYTPTGGTAATASVQLTLMALPLAGGSATTVGITFSPVTATGMPQTILAPRLTDLSSLPIGNYYYWAATGTGTGILNVNLMPLV